MVSRALVLSSARLPGQTAAGLAASQMPFNRTRGPRGPRRAEAWRRWRSVVLVLMLCLAIPPASVAAQGTTALVDEPVPPVSFGVSRLDDARLRDLDTSSPPDNAERRSFSTGDVLDPIPKTSSMTFQPTY